MTLAARARGLGTRRLPDVEAALLEASIRDRTAAELAILSRWADDASILTPLVLDEDRRSLRAIVRGLAAKVLPSRRLAGAVPTVSLPSRLLVALANATSFAQLGSLLVDHPLAFDGEDPLEIELALARRYFAIVRPRGALALYVSQLADVENAMTVLLLGARGGAMDPEDCFITGGSRLDHATFLAACVSLEAARDRLPKAFAKTPIAAAVFAAGPAAVEDAALDWHLATQVRLRRVEPLGLAPVVYFVLSRRAATRRLRRAAWHAALGGTS